MTVLSNEERFARLPIWAKEEIRRLQTRAFRAEEELALFRLGTYGPADTDTIAEPYRDVPVNLPLGVTIAFPAPQGGTVRVRRVKGYIEVNADGALSVKPVASNHIELRSAF